MVHADGHAGVDRPAGRGFPPAETLPEAERTDVVSGDDSAGSRRALSRGVSMVEKSLCAVITVG
jgi:hypothetical protein